MKKEQLEEILTVLKNTRTIVSEAAAVGFVWGDGDWLDSLFTNNAKLTAAIKMIEKEIQE